MSHYTDFLQTTLEGAANIARTMFGKVSGTVKPDNPNQVLTDADLAIGKYIIGEITKHFPDHNIIDEETGVTDHGSRYTWVIDPVDGTSNFANGVPEYGIMLGLLEDATPVAGGIALPAFSKLAIAEKGKGAFLNGERMHVLTNVPLSNCLVAYGVDSHKNNPGFTRKECALIAEIILNVRSIRSTNSVYDAVLVAEGKYAAFLHRNSKIWDNVAQQVMIEEAGGLYTDFFGKPIDYSDPLQKTETVYTWCAAAPDIHRQLQEIIHANA